MIRTLILTGLLAFSPALQAQQSTLGEGDSSAWAANFGWIEMKPNRPSAGDGFRFGEFACAGWIWSANSGWINLGTGILKTDSMPVLDSDNDGISDAFETAYTGDLTTMTAISDWDKDGQSDKAEYLALTNPFSASSFFQVTQVNPLIPGGTTTALTWTSSPARLYGIETSTDLGIADNWDKSPLDPETFTSDNGSTTTRNTLNPTSDKRFYRVSAKIPLQP